MPYFKKDDINILFIHIPKTGGSSFEVYLSRKYNIELNNKCLFSSFNNNIIPDNNLKKISLQHQTLDTILKYKELLNIFKPNLKIISFVRNPYERIISDLFHWNIIDINTNINNIPSIILEYINASPTKYDNQNIPQNKFLINNNNEIYKNIIIIKTENLNIDIKKYGFHDFKEIQQINTHGKINYYNYLNSESIKHINNHYGKDFEFFKYKKI